MDTYFTFRTIELVSYRQSASYFQPGIPYFALRNLIGSVPCIEGYDRLDAMTVSNKRI